MKNKINVCNLYLFVWVIQIIHAPLRLFGDTISIIVLFCLYFWSLYYFYIAVTKFKLPAFLKTWSVLLLLFSIYAIIRMINPFGYSYNVGFEINSRSFLMEHWTSMLPIYPFYVFAKTRELNEKSIRKWAILFIGVAIIQYYYGRSIALSKLIYSSVVDDVTNNMGYFVAMVMPLMFYLRKKPLLQYIGNVVLIVFVIMSVKRGAIILGLICLVLQLSYSLKRQKRTHSLTILLIVIAIFIFVYFYITKILYTNDYFLFRWEKTLEGNDSNRRNIYSNLIQAYVNKANPVNWLFGFGADGTILLTHRQAHNDWLQILVDHGLVGSIVFLVFWIRAFVSRKRFANNDLKFLFSMVVIMLFVRTLFSMSINDMYISSNLILGYCLANMYSDLIEKH